MPICVLIASTFHTLTKQEEINEENQPIFEVSYLLHDLVKICNLRW